MKHHITITKDQHVHGKSKKEDQLINHYSCNDGIFFLPQNYSCESHSFVFVNNKGYRINGTKASAITLGESIILGARDATMSWNKNKKPAPPKFLSMASTSACKQKKLRERNAQFCSSDSHLKLMPGTLYLVGRSPASHIILAHPTISTLHCALILEEDKIRVIDLQSRNGIRSKGNQITDAKLSLPCSLQLGDLDCTISYPSNKQLIHLPSPECKQVDILVERLSPHNAPVHITGESGTGKENIARRVHETSGRQGAFVVINAATLHQTLSRSELFGCLKGAFTGADQARDGAFVRAHRGTLFLDEIGELDASVQAELLRAVEYGEVRPVGATEARTVDVRLVTATHKNLQDHVRQNKFREDLFHRISVLPIHIAPLRERPDDIIILAKHFAMNTPQQKSITMRGLEKLLAYRWPGNIRELQNVILRASMNGTGQTIKPTEIKLMAPQKDPSLWRYHFNLAAQSAYLSHQGDLTKTAQALGMRKVVLKRLLTDHP